jgi:HSP20 family protein
MPVDLVHFMRAFFLPAGADVLAECWQPATDLYRTANGWLVKFDLAGVDPNDVSIEIEGRRLTIHGYRRDWCLAEGCHCQLMEIAYNRFERSLLFPEELQRARISTEFRMGFVLVRIDKETDQ